MSKCGLMRAMRKVAIVTGSAKGLGRYLTLAFANQGYTVVIHYRQSKKEAQKVFNLIQKKSPASIIVSGDLCIQETVGKIFKEIYSKLGRVDLLVNNVGDFIYKEFAKTTNQEFVNIVESNLYPALFCSRAVLPHMRKAKSGHIINIGTVGAERLTLRKKSTPYFAAKNALYYLTKVMAWEEASAGIHVNMVSPASLTADIFKSSDFPMGRLANYEDVVKVISFLTSKDAYYINGANIEVAGAFVPGFS